MDNSSVFQARKHIGTAEPRMTTSNYTNLRLSGIPGTYNKHDVKNLLYRGLQAHSELEDDVQIRSLAMDPSGMGHKIATLTLPKRLMDLVRLDPETQSLLLHVRDGYGGQKTCEDGNTAPRLVLDSHFYGLTPLHSEDDEICDNDFVAISGLNGHAFGSFKARAQQFMWLRDRLPRDLPHCRVFIYGYDTQLVGSISSQGILDLGLKFCANLRSLSTDTERSRNLVLLGHSLGGLILENAIVRMTESSSSDDRKFYQSIRGIMLFGVPQLGMSVEALTTMVANQPNQYLVTNLRNGSEFLESQQQHFSNACKKLKAKIIAFYETKDSRTVERKDGRWQLTGPLTRLVEKHSAVHGSNECLPIDRDHSEIVKFMETDEDYDQVVARILRLLGHKEIELTDDQREALRKQKEMQENALRSLAFLEQDWRRDEITKTYNNTCDWLIRNLQFQSWLNHPRTLLWIQGKPGSGKSTLMKYALNVTETKVKWTGELGDAVVASFFFHGRGTSLQRTKLGLFRSLLNQILAHPGFTDILAGLASRYQERCDTRGLANAEWTEGELCDVFEKCMLRSSSNRTIFILVDALDECGEAAEEVVSLFEGLVEAQERYAEPKSDLRILFSCRHYPVLNLDPDLIIIMEDENTKDIEVVVDFLLGKRFKKSTDQDIVRGRIVEKANGMFQWATMVTSRAVTSKTRGKMTPAILKQIEQTPASLHSLYETLLRQDCLEERETTIKLFQWLLFAKRPLNIHELQHAIIADANMTFTAVSQFTDHFSNIEQAVKEWSKGLVEMTDHNTGERIAQFIHASVQEYLLEKGGLAGLIGLGAPSSLSGAGHFQISRSCLKILFLQSAYASPLVNYARFYWIFHVMEVERAGIDQKDLLDIFLWKDRADRVPVPLSLPRLYELEVAFEHGNQFRNTSIEWSLTNWWHDLQGAYRDVWTEHGGRPILSGLWSLVGITSTLKEMERRVPSLYDVQGTGSESLLLYALFGRHETVIQNILAQLKPQNLKTPDNFGYSELYLATAMERQDLVRRILGAGSDVDRVNGTGPIPDRLPALFLAAIKGNENIVRELLDSDASINERCINGWTALHAAAQEAHEPVVRLLLKRGARADIESTSRQTPLHAAAYAGNESIVRCLLEEGTTSCPKDVFLNQQDNQEATAFTWAIRRNHLPVCRLLARQGADVDTRCKHDGMSPLREAVWRGNMGMVRFLLSVGADPNAGNLNPLSLALSRNSTDMLAILLYDGGADPNRPKLYGYSLLTFAISNDHTEAAKIILECSRTDPNLPDQAGRTALTLAISNGRDTLISILLALGKTDLNLADGNGDTPLTLAAKTGRADIAAALIEFDVVYPNLSDCYGRTPLALAMKGGHTDVVDVLLKSNAIIPDLIDRDGRTPLMHSVLLDLPVQDVSGRTEAARFTQRYIGTGKFRLLDARDKDGETLLSLAVEADLPELVHLLLAAYKVNPNTQNSMGTTPLMRAAMNGQLTITKHLLACENIDLDVSDNCGWTSLSSAVVNGHMAVANIILNDERSDMKVAKDSLTDACFTAIDGGCEDFLSCLPELRPRSFLPKLLSDILTQAQETDNPEIIQAVRRANLLDSSNEQRVPEIAI